jgi:hypothetical protein
MRKYYKVTLGLADMSDLKKLPVHTAQFYAQADSGEENSSRRPVSLMFG